MTLAPFYAAPLHIQVHIVAALLVVVLSPLQFRGFRKGSPAHRASGYLWMAAMVVVALSSFLIPSTMPVKIGAFGPIHLLSVLALISVVGAIRYARAHNVAGHRKTLIGLSIGFWAAAAFTLLPSRIMGQIFFGVLH